MPATVAPTTIDYSAEIKRLKNEKNAVILAHYYVVPEIQDIADFIGDSLGLSQQAEKTDASMIVFCGVRFMAETAKILNQTKKVVLPDLDAGCSLEMSCPTEPFRKFREEHPDHVVISYINCSSEIKTLSDIICTSSNAEAIIRSVPAEKKIIFAPDKNLGRFLAKKTGRDMLLWDGACMVHEAFSVEKLLKLHSLHPNAKIIAHPESEEPVLRVANYIGSTTGMINYVKNDPHDEFIVATEAGIMHEMMKAVPHKKIIAAPAMEDNTCACSECHFMKMNTMQKLYLCMKNEKPEIVIDEVVRLKALKPIKRMLEISKQAGL